MSQPRHLPEITSVGRWTCSTGSGPSRARQICAAGNGVISGSKPAAMPLHPWPGILRDFFAGGFTRRAYWWRECVIIKAVWRFGICGSDRCWSMLGEQGMTGSRRLFPHGTAAGLHQFHRSIVRAAAGDFTALEYRDTTDGRRIALGCRVHGIGIRQRWPDAGHCHCFGWQGK